MTGRWSWIEGIPDSEWELSGNNGQVLATVRLDGDGSWYWRTVKYHGTSNTRADAMERAEQLVAYDRRVVESPESIGPADGGEAYRVFGSGGVRETSWDFPTYEDAVSYLAARGYSQSGETGTWHGPSGNVSIVRVGPEYGQVVGRSVRSFATRVLGYVPNPVSNLVQMGDDLVRIWLTGDVARAQSLVGRRIRVTVEVLDDD